MASRKDRRAEAANELREAKRKLKDRVGGTEGRHALLTAMCDLIRDTWELVEGPEHHVVVVLSARDDGATRLAVALGLRALAHEEIFVVAIEHGELAREVERLSPGAAAPGDLAKRLPGYIPVLCVDGGGFTAAYVPTAGLPEMGDA